MSLKVGQSAPEFKLFDTEKQELSLSELKGKPVVLLFFPFAFTGVCTAELCTVRDEMADYNEVGAEVLGISVDSLHVLKRFKADNNYNFRMLSDFNKTTSIDYGTIYEVFAQGAKGVSKRSAFIIDKDGIIQHIEILENAGEVPDFNKIKEVLKGL